MSRLLSNSGGSGFAFWIRRRLLLANLSRVYGTHGIAPTVVDGTPWEPQVGTSRTQPDKQDLRARLLCLYLTYSWAYAVWLPNVAA